MAWTTPRTWFAGEYVTSDFMNAQLRDNFNILAIPYDTSTGILLGLTTTYFASLSPLVLAQKGVVTPANNSGAAETNLLATPLTAGQLSANGMGFRVTGWGTTTNSANTKYIITYVIDAGGADRLGGFYTGQFTASQANRWEFETVVLRTGAATGTGYWNFVAGPVAGGATTHGEKSTGTTRTWSLVVNVQTNGIGGASSEITQLGQILEVIY